MTHGDGRGTGYKEGGTSLCSVSPDLSHPLRIFSLTNTFVPPLSQPATHTRYVLPFAMTNANPTNAPNASRSTTPVTTPVGSPKLTPQADGANIETIYDVLDGTYSPSRPGFVFNGDWKRFCNIDLVCSAPRCIVIWF